MTLMARIARGPERGGRRWPVELERRTELTRHSVAVEIHVERDDRPEWLRRASFNRDLTRADT